MLFKRYFSEELNLIFYEFNKNLDSLRIKEERRSLFIY